VRAHRDTTTHDPTIEEVVRQFRTELPLLSYWYGFKPDEILSMPGWIVDIYVSAIPVLRAMNTLDMIIAVSAPNMKDQDRKKTIRDLEKTVNEYFSLDQPKPRLSPAELAKMGIGFVYEKRK